MSTPEPARPTLTDALERMVTAYEALDRIRAEERHAIDTRDEARLMAILERKLGRMRELETLRILRAVLRGA